WSVQRRSADFGAALTRADGSHRAREHAGTPLVAKRGQPDADAGRVPGAAGDGRRLVHGECGDAAVLLVGRSPSRFSGVARAGHPDRARRGSRAARLDTSANAGAEPDGGASVPVRMNPTV